MVSDSEQHMSTHEVAEILGITIQTLYNWLKREEIPEPKRNELTGYRLWTPQDFQRIRELKRKT